MKILLQNAKVYRNRAFESADVVVSDGRISTVSEVHPPLAADQMISLHSCFLFPGFVDVHVHLREPGFSYKETIASGTMAAAAGGFTTVCAMPNLRPVPDSPETLAEEERLIDASAHVHVRPYGAITRGEQGREAADLAGLAPRVVAFSDDGKGVQDEDMMRAVMQRARSLGKIVAAHCEDESLLGHDPWGGSPESEWQQVRRDLRLAAETGCAYHVCHVSTRESVALIRDAKRSGIDVTAETAPHYLLLSERDRRPEGRFRMNPPLRTEADREALLEAVADGTIDMIATDHAPHTAAEKEAGANGVTGLETAFPVLYTGLVQTGLLSLETLIERMHDAPCRRFGLGSALEPGAPADLTAFDLNQTWTIDETALLSMGKCTPFHGRTVSGLCRLTMIEGKIVWQNTRAN